MKKLGLGYDELKQINPGLVYCEISGFGRSGPFTEQVGFDLIAQGMSGLMCITGEEPGRSPVKVGAPLTDITAGILGALGAVSALVQRNASGQGQRWIPPFLKQELSTPTGNRQSAWRPGFLRGRWVQPIL